MVNFFVRELGMQKMGGCNGKKYGGGKARIIFLSGGILEGVWKMFGRCLGLWMMSDGCLDGSSR